MQALIAALSLTLQCSLTIASASFHALIFQALIGVPTHRPNPTNPTQRPTVLPLRICIRKKMLERGVVYLRVSFEERRGEGVFSIFVFRKYQRSRSPPPRRLSNNPSLGSKASAPGYACSFGNGCLNAAVPDLAFTVLGTADHPRWGVRHLF